MLSINDIARQVDDLCRQSPPDHPLAPSAMWSEYLAYLDYVRDLPEQHLHLIRLHAGLICGWPWFKYMGSRERSILHDQEKKDIKEILLYRRFADRVPEKFQISEPINDRKMEILGISYQGRLVNFDIIRYQTTITNLYGAGILQHLIKIPEIPRVVEIGGGYGGLAYQMIQVLNRRCNYVVIDFPEMLFFVAHFIRANLPDFPISFHDPSRKAIDSAPGLVLVPHYACDALAAGTRTSLMVNMLSFQEMRSTQIEIYADLAAVCLDGWLYSSNWHRHRLNQELTRSVDSILESRLRLFTRYEPQLIERLSAVDNTLFNHLATSLRAIRVCPQTGNKIMWGESYEITYE